MEEESVLRAPAVEEIRIPEPTRAGIDGAMEQESALRALAMEETRIPEPARAGDEGAAAAMMERAAPEDAVPLVELS